MRWFGIVLGVAGALTLQSTLARFAGEVAAAVDVVLVMVVAVALRAGPVTGLFAGSGAGIVQDALSGGLVGVGGLAKAATGFLCGAVAQQFDVSAWLPRLVIVVAATLAHAVLFMGTYVLLDLRTYDAPVSSAALQALGNAVAAVGLFGLLEGAPRLVERRRLRRRARL